MIRLKAVSLVGSLRVGPPDALETFLWGPQPRFRGATYELHILPELQSVRIRHVESGVTKFRPLAKVEWYEIDDTAANVSTYGPAAVAAAHSKK